MPNGTIFFRSADGVHFEPCEPQDGYASLYNVVLPKETGEAMIELKNGEEALTRYANELTGADDPDLLSAAETLIEQRIKEE